MKTILSRLSMLAFTFFSAGAYAQDASPVLGMAKPWQMNFQPPGTPVMERLESMHQYLLYLIIFISCFVAVGILYICLRFNRKRNPVPSKTTHNTLLEVLWTTIPIIILVAIAIPSLRLHYYMQRAVDPDMTIKVVGYQWYWHYEYPDQGGFNYDSYLKKGKDLDEKAGDIRMLSVDNHLVVPIDTTVRVLVTGADVIHSFAIPAFGVKRDGVPGRLNETWFKAEHIGTYFGQCSELCGVGHGFMPIEVDVVSKDDFAAWAKKKRADAGISDEPKSADAKAADAKDEAKAPLAKPESAADTKSVEKRIDEQKDSSKKTGEGKPSTPAANPIQPDEGTKAKTSDKADKAPKAEKAKKPAKTDTDDSDKPEESDSDKAE